MLGSYRCVSTRTVVTVRSEADGEISYRIEFTGQLLVLFREQNSLPLILLLVVSLKLFPLTLAVGNTHTHLL